MHAASGHVLPASAAAAPHRRPGLAARLPNPQDEFALEAEHIHNKLLFDGLNDALDFYRPYGINGQTYPWKNFLQHKQIKLVDDNNF